MKTGYKPTISIEANKPRGQNIVMVFKQKTCTPSTTITSAGFRLSAQRRHTRESIKYTLLRSQHQ